MQESKFSLQDTVKFYNSFSANYNESLSDDLNKQTREMVAEYFVANVGGKSILDFGGGTGLDLSWLAANNYTVYFCEPADGMRKIALDTAAGIKGVITFLSPAESDYANWSTATFPLQFDGVLANFAVINSIENMELLFQKIAGVLKPGAHFIGLILDTSWTGIAKNYLKNFTRAFLQNKTAVSISGEGINRHISFLHTPARITKLSSSFFITKLIAPVPGYGFLMFHLQRRN
jgi:SAM-dependent methyltransferase